MKARNTLGWVFLAALAAGGCGGAKLPSVGSINPFTSSKTISETDRVFLMAAGNWDRNKDNNVTCDEWKAYATELFNAADANRDDMVDQTEWNAITGTDRMFVTANLDYYDANNDGKASRAEFVDKPNPAFALLDAGKSCMLSGEQVAGARSKTEYDVSGKPKETADPSASKNPNVLTRRD